MTKTFPSAAFAQAVTDVAGTPGFWTGPSGEETPGELVAAHLEAVLTLLEKRGWVRVRDNDEAANLPDPDDDTLSVKAMLRGLLRLVRDSLLDTGPLTFTTAWYEMNVADGDARTIAGRLLDELVRARTGNRSAYAEPWVSKYGRTFDEVRDLLGTAASFARMHGPRA
ncbi:DUF6197 family protein [Streptomyces sp. UC1A3]